MGRDGDRYEVIIIDRNNNMHIGIRWERRGNVTIEILQIQGGEGLRMEEHGMNGMDGGIGKKRGVSDKCYSRNSLCSGNGGVR